jgi:4-hydroxy-tetrahydrodipicolinate synthase
MLSGAWSAIVTPFRQGAVDERALREIIEWQIGAGVQGLIPCGSTGESATLSHDEHELVIRIAVEQTRRRVPVFAGTGSNSTAEAVKLTQFARAVGADGALLISPYYNRPTQEGIFNHYKTIAQSADLPLIVYNIPSRTGSNVAPETLARLCQFKQIVGVKEASGSLDQASDIRRLCGERLSILSGDDSLTLPLMAVGATGVISVLTNVMPAQTRALVSAALEGDFAQARALHYRLLPLVRALFVETNPVPVKHAMGLMGKCSPEVRLPLVGLTSASADKVRAAVSEAGLI